MGAQREGAQNYRSADTGRMWDVTPGDHRFLMLRIVPGEVPTELIVVENFFEELQAKVKRGSRRRRPQHP